MTALDTAALDRHTEFATFAMAVRIMLDILDTEGEDALQLADACRAVLSRHTRGPAGRCRECVRQWPCPTLRDMARPLGVSVGADT